MSLVTLGPGQYQLGSVRFGRNTQLPVESVEATGYGVNSTDYQLPRADEMRFGIDTFQPGSINFTIGIVHNEIIPIMSGMTGITEVPGLQNATTALERLHTEWRSDEVRKLYGFVKPLWYCRPDGVTTRIYGRPRKFAHDLASRKANFRKAVCEFQRVDTLCYSEEEYSVTTTPTAEGAVSANIVRSGGMARTWMKIYIFGPINHPKIKIGSMDLIDINHNIASDRILEINSYPWTRRVVDNASLNVAPKLINNSPYLDELSLAAQVTTPVGFSGTGTTGATKMLILWREAYHTM